MSKILVIDDEDDIRINLTELLEAEGFHVLSAENGKVGLQLAQQSLPDLIICDITMPELDGYGVLEQLRQEPATATIPFIFLTAKVEMSYQRQGMNLGADDYLVKPFTRDDLVKAIGTQLGKQAAYAQRLQSKLNDLRSSITVALPHEFRTPLTSILGYSDLLAEESSLVPPQEIQKFAKQINSSARRLHELIVNFLLYTELELIARDSDAITALKSTLPSEIKAAVTETADQQAQHIQRVADLNLEIEPALVRIGSGYLTKLIEELVRNAFKFSLAGTPVHITGQAAGSNYQLVVHDQGRGMTAEQIADVGAYLQFDRQRYEQQGPGLGLSISRRIAELHGGQLDIDSVFGRETTVHVTLPIYAGTSNQLTTATR